MCFSILVTHQNKCTWSHDKRLLKQLFKMYFEIQLDIAKCTLKKKSLLKVRISHESVSL